MIVTILSGNPYWLCYSVSEIDGRLGYLQKTFKLSGEEIRRLATSCPKLVTWGGVPTQVGLNLIMLNESCGFSQDEVRDSVLNPENCMIALILFQCKEILIKCPAVYYEEQEDRLGTIVSFLHNDVGFSHEMLAKLPEAITSKINHIRPRLAFLKSLGRLQVDPNQPSYVSPQAFALTTDIEFCEVAKCSILTYNEFLKTV
jgi:mTERF domain-containing protein